jgi:hypothetical protein
MFSQDGTFVRRFGDRLLVLDFGNGRIAEMSEMGDWLGTRPAPGTVSGSSPRPSPELLPPVPPEASP